MKRAANEVHDDQCIRIFKKWVTIVRVPKIDAVQTITSTKEVLRPPNCNLTMHSVTFCEDMGGLGTMRKGMTVEREKLMSLLH